MIWGGLKGGLNFHLATNHLNFFDEFKGLVRDAVRCEPVSAVKQPVIAVFYRLYGFFAYHVASIFLSTF